MQDSGRAGWVGLRFQGLLPVGFLPWEAMSRGGPWSGPVVVVAILSLGQLRLT